MDSVRDPVLRSRFEIVDSHTVRSEAGAEHSVLEAIEALPWVSQLCPLMPHQYAVERRWPQPAWDILDAMVAGSPDSYRAYFRGYQSPNRYWEAPDGLRYWHTVLRGTHMLNRCTLDSVEPPRRVDEGAGPIKDWDGPPYAPNGAGLYTQDANGTWWPKFEGTGMQPCRGCQRNASG